MLKGRVKKLQTRLSAPIEYALPLDNELVPLNPLLGKQLSLTFLEKIQCLHCNKTTNKSFSQGYCYPCFRRLAACDLCIMRPELCHYAQGTCREPSWGEQHCMQAHVVYLANSSALKVGISRLSQIPTRWIDQGAEQALPIFKVKTRFQSGIVESTLKQWVSDRTNWRLMLQAKAMPIDLLTERDRILSQAQSSLDQATAQFKLGEIELINDVEVQELQYPVLEYPKKIQSHDLEKKPKMEGTLLGIKGQYLIFDTGVINIRKYGGYLLDLAIHA